MTIPHSNVKWTCNISQKSAIYLSNMLDCISLKCTKIEPILSKCFMHFTEFVFELLFYYEYVGCVIGNYERRCEIHTFQVFALEWIISRIWRIRIIDWLMSFWYLRKTKSKKRSIRNTVKNNEREMEKCLMVALMTTLPLDVQVE